MFFACFISARTCALALYNIYIHFIAFKVTTDYSGSALKLFLNYGALFWPDSDLGKTVQRHHPDDRLTRLFISHRGKTIHRPAWQTVEFAVYETK